RVRVYELEGPGPLKTRLDVSRARGLSRFVGRVEETAALEAALRRAGEGRGGVVGIVAEAGVGKSRLCYEFIERTRARGLTAHQAHCVAHGRMVPFLPILELLRGYFGISEQDGNEAGRRKIAGTVLLLDPELTESLPLLFDFLAERSAALLQDLLGSNPSLAGVVGPVRERTAGNPFFIEEVVQALVEGGSLVGTKGAYRLVKPVAELVVPPTVHAVLAARIDRL